MPVAGDFAARIVSSITCTNNWRCVVRRLRWLKDNTRPNVHPTFPPPSVDGVAIKPFRRTRVNFSLGTTLARAVQPDRCTCSCDRAEFPDYTCTSPSKQNIAYYVMSSYLVVVLVAKITHARLSRRIRRSDFKTHSYKCTRAEDLRRLVSGARHGRRRRRRIKKPLTTDPAGARSRRVIGPVSKFPTIATRNR